MVDEYVDLGIVEEAINWLDLRIKELEAAMEAAKVAIPAHNAHNLLRRSPQPRTRTVATRTVATRTGTVPVEAAESEEAEAAGGMGTRGRGPRRTRHPTVQGGGTTTTKRKTRS